MSDGLNSSSPLIEYPTRYLFKALGLAEPGFAARVRALVELASSIELAESDLSTRSSSAGKYLSLSIQVTLQSEDQRRAVYEAFKSEKSIAWYV